MSDTTIDLPPATTATAWPHEPPPPLRDLLCTIATIARLGLLDRHHCRTCSEKKHDHRTREKTQQHQNETRTLNSLFWVKTKIQLNLPTLSRLASLIKFTKFTPSLPSLVKNWVYFWVNSIRVCGNVNSDESTSWLASLTTMVVSMWCMVWLIA